MMVSTSTRVSSGVLPGATSYTPCRLHDGGGGVGRGRRRVDGGVGEIVLEPVLITDDRDALVENRPLILGQNGL